MKKTYCDICGEEMVSEPNKQGFGFGIEGLSKHGSDISFSFGWGGDVCSECKTRFVESVLSEVKKIRAENV